MAILPLAAREILTNLTSDLGMRPPAYSHDTDIHGLVTVVVVVQLTRSNIAPVEKTFTSPPEDTLTIAEDITSRMVLRYIETYYAGDHHVSAYLNSRVFVRTKKAWEEVANRLANQLDIARNTIRKLHDKMYQNNLNHSTLTENINRCHMDETLASNTRLQELTEQNSNQHCQLLLLQNRVQYLDNMNTLLCINHPNLLQLPTAMNTSTSVNSVHANLLTNETTSMPPALSTHANITEL